METGGGDGERRPWRERQPSGKATRDAGDKGRRQRSAPGGWRPQQPRALPARKWNMYAPPRRQGDEQGAPVVASTFRVLSFNVLADYIVQRDQGNGEKLGAKYEWNHRKGKLVKEILAWAPHVVCLQEVDHYEDFFEPELRRRGFVGVYKQRTGPETLDGCAIFVRKSVARVVSVHPIEYYKEDDPTLDRHNIALALVLALKGSPDHPFIIANTHLLFNPGRGDVKIAQLKMLLESLEKLRVEEADHPASPLPVVLCGDFNTAPHSALYHFIAEGNLDATGLSKTYLSGQNFAQGDNIKRAINVNENDFTRHYGHGTAPGKFNTDKARRSDYRNFPADSPAFSHTLEFASAYAQQPTDITTGEPKFTTFHSGTKATVDYIWYSSPSLHCHGVVEMTPAGILFKHRELPTMHHPSDHLSLIADFSLRATHA